MNSTDSFGVPLNRVTLSWALSPSALPLIREIVALYVPEKASAAE